jgi:MFS family permease
LPEPQQAALDRSIDMLTNMIDKVHSTRHWIGFPALVLTQSASAFTENTYKIIVGLIAVDASVTIGKSYYLSLSGVLFVLPFLLVSGYAGQVADRFDKRKVLICLKMSEMVAVLVGIATIALGRIELVLASLCLLAMLAAFSSPAKYGLLPEILPARALPCGNAWLEITRYAGVIAGSAAGGLLMAGNRAGSALMVAVLLGSGGVTALASLLIVRGERAVSAQRLHWNPWQDVGVTLRHVATVRPLAVAIVCLTMFETLSTLMLLDAMMFGKRTLGITDVQIGFLPVAAGIGIGIGCALASRACRQGIRLALASRAFFGIGTVLLAIVAFDLQYVATVGCFAALGFLGGFVVVPCNALIQARSAGPQAGRTIALNNLLNMTGVLIGSAALWFLHDAIALSPRSIFGIVGLAALAVAGVVSRTLRPFRPA